ncbi:hypothetical protein [Thioalkalivibrio sp. ALE19]|uniref:hypothetical protein n=1 Tax=Thioalkalivibrio sp. ALE19 TaxID=1266909 RepID=UPI0003F9BA37|nr:hypothetical protein [Thioalkalivibrio sp. ALE19]
MEFNEIRNAQDLEIRVGDIFVVRTVEPGDLEFGAAPNSTVRVVEYGDEDVTVEILRGSRNPYSDFGESLEMPRGHLVLREPKYRFNDTNIACKAMGPNQVASCPEGQLESDSTGVVRRWRPGGGESRVVFRPGQQPRF